MVVVLVAWSSQMSHCLPPHISIIMYIVQFLNQVLYIETVTSVAMYVCAHFYIAFWCHKRSWDRPCGENVQVGQEQESCFRYLQRLFYSVMIIISTTKSILCIIIRLIKRLVVTLKFLQNEFKWLHKCKCPLCHYCFIVWL